MQLESARSLIYPSDPKLWVTNLCPIGAARKWIEDGKTGPLPSWLTEEEAKTHERIMMMKG